MGIYTRKNLCVKILGGGGRARNAWRSHAGGGETLSTVAVGWRASVVRGEDSGRFCEVTGVSMAAAGGLTSVTMQQN